MHPILHAQSSPDRPAVIMAGTGQAVTYGEMDASANRLKTSSTAPLRIYTPTSGIWATGNWTAPTLLPLLFMEPETGAIPLN